MEFYQYNETETVEPWLYSLCRCGLNEVSSDFHIYRKKLYPYSNIHYVISGQFKISFDGETYIANAGDCFVLPGFKEHEYNVSKTGNTTIQWMEFYGSDSIRLVERIINLGNGPVISLGKDKSDVTNLLGTICSKDSLFEKSTAIYELFMYLMKIRKDKQPDDLVQRGLSFKDLVAFIEENIGEPLKLDELSKHSGYSVSRLIELFKKEFDTTPKQYIYQRRINLVKKMLTNVDLSLDVIAEKVGFYDASHLVRRFKEQEGLTPKQYKREILQYKIR